MRTNEQFKQEVIKRAEKYKKEKRLKRKKFICSFAALAVCVISLAAAIPKISVGSKTASGSSEGSSYSELYEVKGYAAKDSMKIKEDAMEVTTETVTTCNAENMDGGYSVEIDNGEISSYTADRELVSAIYTAVNNAFDAGDNMVTESETTRGEIYEITLIYEGVESKYSFNGSALKKGESGWINISETSAEEIKSAIDKII